MKVIKFGGSSVRDAAHIRKVIDIVSADGSIRAVICSAMKGITNDLISCAQMAETGNNDYTRLINDIRQRQKDAVAELFDDELAASKVQASLMEHCDELEEICHGVFLVKECSPRSMDLIMSFGERLNNQLIAAYATTRGMTAFYVDSRPLVLTDASHGNASVDFEESYRRISGHFAEKAGVGFVTGFIAGSPEGITTTLGRNGSDYSASIFGAALEAEDIEIWTDVDGVLEADPRIVPEAAVIEELKVEEAMELSYFGAEVLHPSTMIPAIETGIPVWIKNTLNPSARGTRIATDAADSPKAATGIASIGNIRLLNIVGGGMIGARGIAMKIFAALARGEANAIMISQASSEHSICVVIRTNEVEKAVRVLKEDLASEISRRTIQNIEVINGLEVVAIIGANMRGTPGVSGRLFSAVGDAGVNIYAIAQGSSEMNISFVIDASNHAKCLNAVHEAFFRQAGGK